MNLVLAFDPGYSTGVSLLRRYDRKSFDIVTSVVINWQDRFSIYPLCCELVTNLEAVVCEDFRLADNARLQQAQTHSYFPSVRIIGIIELTCFSLGIIDRLQFQTPSQRKNVTIAPDEKKQLVQSPHAFDSFMHAKYYVLTHKR